MSTFLFLFLLISPVYSSTCNRGSYYGWSVNSRVYTCVNCDGGKYQDEEGQTQCKDCPMGSYQRDSGEYLCNRSCVQNLVRTKPFNVFWIFILTRLSLQFP